MNPQIFHKNIVDTLTNSFHDESLKLRKQGFQFWEDFSFGRKKRTPFDEDWYKDIKNIKVQDFTIQNKEGIKVYTLQEAIKQELPEIKKYFGRIVRPTENIFTSIHYSLLNTGLLIIVPENTTLKKPIILKENIKLHTFDHILLIIKKGAKATFIEDISSLTDNLIRNQVVEVIVEEGAELTYVTFQDLKKTNHSSSFYRASVENSGKILWFTGNFGSQTHKLFLESHLIGEGSESEIRGVFYGNRNQRMELNIGNTYDALHTKGEMKINGAVKDTAVISCNGLIHITKKGQYASSYLKQKNIILDNTAHINATPELQISANEVKAGHGASITKVNPEDLFYLQSRGIQKDNAETLIINGFLQEFSKEFEHIPYIQERTKELIEKQ